MNETPLTKPRKLFAVLPPVLLIVANIFLFGPFTIYSGNINEFAISLIDIIKNFLLPSLSITVFLILLGVFLPERLHKRYVAIMFALGILIWLQGNILVWDYGVFGYGDINWAEDIWRGWVDAVIWVLLLFFAFYFYRQFNKIASSTSIVLTLLQAALLIFNSFQHPEVWKEKPDYSQPPKELFEFSSNQNVIHVILDEFQSDIFEKIIKEDTSYYYEIFDGFTYFKETVGASPRTIMSIPAFLSGQVYKNDIPIQTFIDTVYKGKTIPNVLLDNGYEVDLIASEEWYSRSRYTNWYNVPIPYGVAKEVYEQTNATLMMNLTTFRHVPHFLKKYAFQGQISFSIINLKNTQLESYWVQRHLSHRAFLQDLIENTSIRRNKPVYKLIHLNTTHWPIVLNKQCEYTGQVLPLTWESIKIQDKCSLDHFLGFLHQLKKTGIYEDALIIIQADHGYWKMWDSRNQISLQNLDKNIEKDFLSKEDFAQKVCASAPLLLIKPPHSKGRLQSSVSQVMITDIPATLTFLLGLKEQFTGRSAFEISPDEVRERRFYYYYEINRPDDKFFDRIDEYLIKGPARDRMSWQYIMPHIKGEMLYASKKIVLDADETVRFLRTGWSFKEKGYRWAVGNSASILVSLPQSKVKLTANVRSLFFDKPQSVSVKVDGKVVGTWENLTPGQWEQHSVTIPPDKHRPSVSVVEFNFSTYRQPDEKEKRRLALLFESITIEEQLK